MKYINKKTKAVIETACEIKGGDWVEMKQKKGKKKPEADSKPQTAQDENESGEQ